MSTIFFFAEGEGALEREGVRCFSPGTEPKGYFPTPLTVGEGCAVRIEHIDGEGNIISDTWTSLVSIAETQLLAPALVPTASIGGIAYVGNLDLYLALVSGANISDITVDEAHPPFVLISPGSILSIDGAILPLLLNNEPIFLYLTEYFGSLRGAGIERADILLKDVLGTERAYGSYKSLAIPSGKMNNQGEITLHGSDIQYHKGTILSSWDKMAPSFVTSDDVLDPWGRPYAMLDLRTDAWRTGSEDLEVVLPIPPNTFIDQSLIIHAKPIGADTSRYVLQQAMLMSEQATEGNQPFEEMSGTYVGLLGKPEGLTPEVIDSTIKVLWDGEVFTCTYREGEVDGTPVYYLGNGAKLNLEGNGEPFLLIYPKDVSYILTYTVDDSKVAAIRVVSAWFEDTVVERLEPIKITANGTYTPDQGFGWGEITVNVPSGGIETITTAEEMDAKLVAENVGNAYRYIGAATEFYATGDFYIVEEDS